MDSVISDENLEGDGGSELGNDDEDFPCEWMVIDDVAKEVMLTDTEDESTKTKNDEYSVKKQGTLLKCSRDKPSSDRKKDYGKSVSNRNDEKRMERSQDRKSKDAHHQSRKRSRDRKPDSSSRHKILKDTCHHRSRSHDRKSDSSSRDRNHRSPEHNSKPVDMNLQPEKFKAEEKLESDSATSEYPLPKMSFTNEAGEDFSLFSSAKQSLRCRLVTGGADTPPKVEEFFNQKIIRWGLRLYPFFADDLILASKEMKKVINVSAAFSCFLFRIPKVPKCGDLSLMFHHKNTLRSGLNAIFCLPLKSSEVNIFVNRRTDDNTYETGELKLTQWLTHNLGGKIKAIGEGSPENRSITVKNIPEGTSMEMMEVLFPNSNKVTFSKQGKRDKTWSATIMFHCPMLAKSMTLCYKEVKIGDNKLTLTFTGKVEKKAEEKKMKPVLKSKPKTNITHFKKRSNNQIKYYTNVSKRLNVKKLQQRQWQQQKEVARAKMALKQQKVMLDQQTAMMQSNMIRPSETPGIPRPPPVLKEMRDFLQNLPQDLSPSEKNSLLVLEQQRRQLEQNQLLQLQQLQQLQQQQKMQKQFQKPLGNPNSQPRQGDNFMSGGEDIRGDMSLQKFGRMMTDNQQNLLVGQKRSESHFDRSDDMEFDNKVHHGRTAMEHRTPRQGSHSSEHPQSGILPARAQRTGNPYVLPASTHTRSKNPNQEDLDRSVPGRNKPETNVFSRDRISDRDRSSQDRPNRDASNLEMLGHRDVVFKRDMMVANHTPGREMLNKDRLQRDMIDEDMAYRGIQRQNISGCAVQDRGYGDRDFVRIQQSRMKQSAFSQQRHEFNEPPYSRYDEPGMLVQEYDHGNKPNKR